MLKPLVTSAIIVLSFAFARLAGAQNPSIACIQDPDAKPGTDCKITVRSGIEPLLLRIDDGGPVKDAKVSVKGPQTLNPATAVSDAHGMVEITWTGATLTAPATIEIEATNGAWVTKRNLILQPRVNAPTFSPIILGVENTSRPIARWYAGHQLREPLRVQLGSLSGDACTKGIVVFKSVNDAPSPPDSVRGSIENNTCVAESLWKLGPTIGEQRMRIFPADDPSKAVVVRAESRKTPWLAGGLAYSYNSKYVKLTPATSQVGAKVDSIVAGPTFAPIVGVNTPLRTTWSYIRVSLNADPRHLDTDWFAGISLSQLHYGIIAEDIDVDLQFIVHLERRTFATNSDVCFATPATCNKEVHVRPVGFGLAAQFNTTSFLSTVTGFLFK